jgi:hypothetical protein
LLHAEKADDSEVKREFRYLSITLFGTDKEKMNSLAADKTTACATKNREFSSFRNKS